MTQALIKAEPGPLFIENIVVKGKERWLKVFSKISETFCFKFKIHLYDDGARNVNVIIM